MAERSILDEQMAYYRARAAEYDEWFYREGRYDRGPAETRAWFDEVRIVSEELGRFGVRGDVLELACGTGIWTALLARRASSVTAVDASVEMLSINRAKLSERDRVGKDGAHGCATSKPIFSIGSPSDNTTPCFSGFGCPTFRPSVLIRFGIWSSLP